MKSQIFAVIDIGTLKIKSEVVSVASDGTFTRIYSSNILTCFGVGLDTNNGEPLQENLNNTITELLRLRAEFKKLGVKNVKVVSTHVMRKLAHSKKIQNLIKNKTGYTIEIISQKREAELFFKAVMNSFTEYDTPYTVVDVGGGSVQILTGTKEKLGRAYSVPLGTVTLQERFVPDIKAMEDYLTTDVDIEKTKEYILQEIGKLSLPKKSPIIYGSSMIIDVIKVAQLPTEPNPSSKTHPYRVYAESMKNVIAYIKQFTFTQRDAIYTELPHRFSWGIDMGFLNIVTIAEHLQSPYIIPSNANIAQGLVYEMSENH